MSDETATVQDTGPTAETSTWAYVVEAALELESRPDAFGLLTLITITKGKAGVQVPVDALAEQLDVTASTAKAMLGRLEDIGWVRRRAELVEGRPVLVWDTTVAVR